MQLWCCLLLVIGFVLFFLSYRFYPYHYAPFVSDIKGIGDMSIKFDLSVPFLPFEQLLAVLPANSKSLLPEAYQVSIASDKPQYFDCVEINLKRMNIHVYVLVCTLCVTKEKRSKFKYQPIQVNITFDNVF